MCKIGMQYSELFRNINSVKTPHALEGNYHIFSQYTILTENRDYLSNELSKKGIPSAVYYPIPAHKQPIFKTNEFHLPVSEYVSQRAISLPMHPYLDAEQQKLIVNNCLDIINAPS